jgi:hypothetical protein
MKHYILLILSVFFASAVCAQQEEQQTQKLRYFNHTQASLLIGEESEDQTRKAMIPSFQTVNGVLIGKHFGAGIGVGAEPFEFIAFPVFLSGYYFVNNNKKASPYFVVKSGYAFSNSHKKLNYYYGDYDNRGGLMINPEMGIQLTFSGFDLTLSGGYRFQRLESRITQENSHYVYKRTVDYNRISFALGIMF